MSPASQYRLALVGLAASGAALVLASSRWEQSGEPVLPALAPVGWLVMAAVPGVVATAGLARILVGSLVVLTAASMAVLAIGSSTPLGAWGAVAVLGAVLGTLVGAAVVLRGRRWPGMSARFGTSGDADGARPGAKPVDPWRALDRGEDPTLGPHATE